VLAGLNVFLLDTDVVFFHDPYKYLKSRFANYSLFSLSDSSVDVAKGNGGVWYLQNVLSRGPIAQRLLAAFEERTLCLVNRSDLPTIRYTDFRTGAPADRLLDDQFVMNNAILASVAVGQPVVVNAHTADNFKGRVPRFWKASEVYRPTPPELGTYAHLYPPNYSLRERALELGGVTEMLVQAPPWLFAGESDADAPPAMINGSRAWSGRITSSLWAAQPSPVTLVHFVCFAWPGSGGRVAAMRLWGRWHQPDISAQLASDASVFPPSTRLAAPPFGFDAHAWLRACGLACGLGQCEPTPSKKGDPLPRLKLCADWLHKTSWRQAPLRAWSEQQQWAQRPPPPEEIEEAVRREAWHAVQPPPELVGATTRAAARHPAALVAFRRPLLAADRREYQLWVHVLHSAAMLTARRPVVPLAHCNQAGEWGEFSRCSFVLRSTPANQPYCVMRPPSACIDRVALPSDLAHVPPEEVAVARLPQLPLKGGKVDAAAFASALADAGGTDKQLLLLDTEALSGPDDVSSLLVSPKGWLCTLEHKSCQYTCV
jgi:hypothetical protein